MKSGNEVYVAISKLIFGIIVFAVIFLYQAWVLSLGWHWFVVPLGAPSIGYAHALGLSVLAHMAAGASGSSDSKDGLMMALFKAAIKITFLLVFMFVYTLFM